MAESKTKLYRMLHGKHSALSEEKGVIINYVEGDEVPLTDSQYEAFKDKFETPKEKKSAEKKAGLAPGEDLKTATKPDEPVDNKAAPAPSASPSNPQGNQTGAGAAAHSTNTAKV